MFDRKNNVCCCACARVCLRGESGGLLSPLGPQRPAGPGGDGPVFEAAIALIPLLLASLSPQPPNLFSARWLAPLT